MLEHLQAYGASLGRKFVFRPHVGEGSSLLDKGTSLVELAPVAFVKGAMKFAIMKKEDRMKGLTSKFFDWLDRDFISRSNLRGKVRNFNIYKKRRLDSDVKEMSINNIQVFIDALHAAGFPQKYPNVIVRFGHVTHVTKKQAIAMAKLGIHADVNLGSNMRTGSLTFLKDLHEAKQRKAVFGDWNKDWSSLVDREHGLMNLLNAGVMVALGTDGQGVEETSINTEYHLAEEYLKDYKISGRIQHRLMERYCNQLLNNAMEMALT